jgi:hypothetical protein
MTIIPSFMAWFTIKRGILITTSHTILQGPIESHFRADVVYRAISGVSKSINYALYTFLIESRSFQVSVYVWLLSYPSELTESLAFQVFG